MTSPANDALRVALIVALYPSTDSRSTATSSDAAGDDDTRDVAKSVSVEVRALWRTDGGQPDGDGSRPLPAAATVCLSVDPFVQKALSPVTRVALLPPVGSLCPVAELTIVADGERVYYTAVAVDTFGGAPGEELCTTGIRVGHAGGGSDGAAHTLTASLRTLPAALATAPAAAAVEAALHDQTALFAAHVAHWEVQRRDRFNEMMFADLVAQEELLDAVEATREREAKHFQARITELEAALAAATATAAAAKAEDTVPPSHTPRDAEGEGGESSPAAAPSSPSSVKPTVVLQHERVSASTSACPSAARDRPSSPPRSASARMRGANAGQREAEIAVLRERLDTLMKARRSSIASLKARAPPQPPVERQRFRRAPSDTARTAREGGAGGGRRSGVATPARGTQTPVRARGAAAAVAALPGGAPASPRRGDARGARGDSEGDGSNCERSASHQLDRERAERAARLSRLDAASAKLHDRHTSLLQRAEQFPLSGTTANTSRSSCATSRSSSRCASPSLGPGGSGGGGPLQPPWLSNAPAAAATTSASRRSNTNSRHRAGRSSPARALSRTDSGSSAGAAAAERKRGIGGGRAKGPELAYSDSERRRTPELHRARTSPSLLANAAAAAVVAGPTPGLMRTSPLKLRHQLFHVPTARQ